MDAVVQVVGFKHGVSSKGSAYTVLHIISDFDDYMQKNGAVGCKAENIYILGDIKVQLGAKYNLVYGVGFGGKAIVKDVIPVVDKK